MFTSQYMMLAQHAVEMLQRAEPLAPTAEQRMAYEAMAANEGSSRIMRVNNGVADISVDGVLTPRPSLFALLFGGGNTAYSDIRGALHAARGDSSVREARFNINSPGGTVEGYHETIAAIEAFKASGKTMSVVAGFATSAAYGLAAASGKIHAAHAGATFGSIGIAASYFVSPSIVDITSTDAPNKRPDVTTESGKAMVREHLDELHEIFVAGIAKGRGKDPEEVNRRFGKGGLVIAGGALTRGMIDSLGGKLPELSMLTRQSDTALAAQMVMLGKLSTGSTPRAQAPDVGDLVCEAMFGPDWQTNGRSKR